FNHFLKAALDRTFAFTEVNDLVTVAEHLHLDMAGAIEITFDVNAFVAEIFFRFGGGNTQRAFQLGAIAGDAHAFATTAGGGFHYQRKSEPGGGVDKSGRIHVHADRWGYGKPQLLDKIARSDFV